MHYILREFVLQILFIILPEIILNGHKNHTVQRQMGTNYKPSRCDVIGGSLTSLGSDGRVPIILAGSTIYRANNTAQNRKLWKDRICGANVMTGKGVIAYCRMGV